MSFESIEQKLPLYSPLSREADDGDGDELAIQAPTPRATSHRKWLIVSIAANIISLVAVCILWYHYRSSIVWRGVRPLHSPVEDIISYEYVRFTPLTGRTKFHAPNNGTDADWKQLDADWNELYQLGISAIPKSQAALLPNRTVPFPRQEENYIITLDVFHQLHCLDMLRQAMWPEQYPDALKDRFSNPTHLANAPPFDHTDHCINSLRETIMCHADTVPVVWQWNDKVQAATPRFDVAHTCKDYRKIHSWAEKMRSTIHFDGKVHIVDDLVFPDDK